MDAMPTAVVQRGDIYVRITIQLPATGGHHSYMNHLWIQYNTARLCCHHIAFIIIIAVACYWSGL